MAPLYALVKIVMTVDGIGCEIAARSAGETLDQAGKFGKQIISNVLELIALPI